MPLLAGKENVGHNIEVEQKAGKPHKQAVAIALNKEREGDEMKSVANPERAVALKRHEEGLTVSQDSGRAKDDSGAHIGMLGVNVDKAKALAASLERNGFEYRFPAAPPTTEMVRHAFRRGDVGEGEWRFLNERKNGYHNITGGNIAKAKDTEPDFLSWAGTAALELLRKHDWSSAVAYAQREIKPQLSAQEWEEFMLAMKRKHKMTDVMPVGDTDWYEERIKELEEEVERCKSEGEPFADELRDIAEYKKEQAERNNAVKRSVSKDEKPTPIKTSNLVPMPAEEDDRERYATDVKYKKRHARDRGKFVRAGDVDLAIYKDWSDDKLREQAKKFRDKDMAAQRYENELTRRDTAKAKDSIMQQRLGSEPADHLFRAHQYEIQGDRARALDSYRAAATGFRRANDRLGEGKARDGIMACQSVLAVAYDHPERGRVRVCDSAEIALRRAVERTRAGEQVSVFGSTVRPGRARDGAFEDLKKQYGGKYSDDVLRQAAKSGREPWSINLKDKGESRNAKDVEVTYHYAEKPKPKPKLLSVADPAERKQMAMQKTRDEEVQPV